MYIVQFVYIYIHTFVFKNIYFACFSVCPIYAKTTEPIWPPFLYGILHDTKEGLHG